MMIEFAADALNHKGSFSWLTRILFLVEDGRHEWYIPEPTPIIQSTFFNNLGHLKVAFNDLFERSIGRSLNKGRFQHINVTCSPKCDNDFLPENAWQYLEKPLLIIVENGQSDGCFIELVLAKFAKRDLYRLKSEGFLEIDGPGGKGEIPKKLERKIQGKLPRIVVLADGDGLVPGEVDHTADKIKNECCNLNVPCHITAKREVENYIPSQHLTRWAESQGKGLLATAQAFRRLTLDQQSFFDMKKGFRGKESEKAKIHIRQEQLYHNVSSSDRQALRPGFGKDVWVVFRYYFEDISKRAIEEISGNEISKFVECIYSRA